MKQNLVGKLLPSVNRNGTIESTRRTSHRKVTILSNGRTRLNEGLFTKLSKEKQEHSTWLNKDFTQNANNIAESTNSKIKNEEDIKMCSIKLGKRTLITEKFTSSRSVKILKRSQN